MVLADDLADCQLFRGFAHVGAHAPDDLAIAADDGEEARLAAGEKDVFWIEALVAGVVPLVGPKPGGGVHVQPFEASRARPGATSSATTAGTFTRRRSTRASPRTLTA